MVKTTLSSLVTDVIQKLQVGKTGPALTAATKLSERVKKIEDKEAEILAKKRNRAPRKPNAYTIFLTKMSSELKISKPDMTNPTQSERFSMIGHMWRKIHPSQMGDDASRSPSNSNSNSSSSSSNASQLAKRNINASSRSVFDVKLKPNPKLKTSAKDVKTKAPPKPKRRAIKNFTTGGDTVHDSSDIVAGGYW